MTYDKKFDSKKKFKLSSTLLGNFFNQKSDLEEAIIAEILNKVKK